MCLFILIHQDNIRLAAATGAISVSLTKLSSITFPMIESLYMMKMITKAVTDIATMKLCQALVLQRPNIVYEKFSTKVVHRLTRTQAITIAINTSVKTTC